MKNKLLILCEGSNEKKIIEILLQHDKLKFTQNDLIGLVPYHARQLTSPVIVSALNMYHGNFDIYRIGDKQNDELKIPRDLKHRIGSIKKYCTKPELEILLILNEGLYQNFLSLGRNKAKQYAKEKISLNKKRYDNSTQFYDDYYGNNINTLIDNIYEYKRVKKHENQELFLADLLCD